MTEPRCPYCGRVMRIRNTYEILFYSCGCGATSPCERTKEDALAAALRRVDDGERANPAHEDGTR